MNNIKIDEIDMKAILDSIEKLIKTSIENNNDEVTVKLLLDNDTEEGLYIRGILKITEPPVVMLSTEEWS